MTSEKTDLLPLFPLNTVLFPGMVLPLHIFEERYRVMVRHCLTDKRPFGVLLIREGKEVGGSAVPYMVGTTARITEVDTLTDGCMNIETVGQHRFRVHRLRSGDTPYLQGEITWFPLTGGESAAAVVAAEAVRPLVTDYVRLLARTAGLHVGLEHLPQDPTTLAFLTAIALQISGQDKQRLLAVESVPGLLAEERDILKSERHLLRFILDSAEAREGQRLGPTGFISLN